MITSAFKRSVLAIGAFGALLAIAPASAQDDGRYEPGYQGTVPEEVEVIAPRYHADRNTFGTPLEKESLSMAVRYDDLDLSSRGGAHELRARVRDAAHAVCEELAARIPIKAYDTPSCYKEATDAAIRRADTAIGEARGAYDSYDASYEY